MKEEKKMIIFCSVIFVVGVLGIFLVNSSNGIGYADIGVKNYEANLYIDKNLTLEEKYTYEILIDGRYRMLYRDWKVPLTYNNNLEIPYIKVSNLSASSKNMVGYVVDYKGNVLVFSNNSLIKKKIKELVVEYNVINEVGFYNPYRYNTGVYTTNYRFCIYPPIETDGKVSHINLKLADEHLPYKNVKINIIDKNNSILNLFVYPSTFKVYKTSFGYTIEGNSPKDEMIEIEMLLKPNSVNGFLNYINGVEEKALSAYDKYILINNIIKFTKYALIAIILLFPLIAYIVYLKYGKEKFYVVPEYLSYVPNKNRKPWVVNLIFNGEVGNFDKNGFYATLLDLHNRGHIKIIRDDGSVKIKILKNDENLNDLDLYEKAVMDFLIRYAKNDEFNPKDLERIVSYRADKYKIKRLWNEINRVMKNPPFSSTLTKKFLETKGKDILWISLAISIILVLILFGISMSYSKYYPTLKDIPYLSFILVIQNIILILTPKSLFGRWKNDYYKEKLEWEAFKNFLSDLAMIKKYSPEDISIWKEWLVYGTALGVGEKVVEAMKSLNINIPEADIAPAVYIAYGSMYSSINNAYSSTVASSSISSGGGFGIGGGFGGGGGGAR
ncbi:hypothetical protein JH146_0298 [Methanocaldococcus bathoardescens]|uniref:DUF2207 domain-containing protein n=1 Tax=Methanocaldococcus bathoardescens TaxID=1301915 RepID=A0A076LI05_9EURY|nr:DUF2207 domain-containing protein [Methanocaldococcus bathoardescens]AIJ05149.1 hypothetical protein JH146_0298 [Methanocaldococcus bathoardescens]